MCHCLLFWMLGALGTCWRSLTLRPEVSCEFSGVTRRMGACISFFSRRESVCFSHDFFLHRLVMEWRMAGRKGACAFTNKRRLCSNVLAVHAQPLESAYDGRPARLHGLRAAQSCELPLDDGWRLFLRVTCMKNVVASRRLVAWYEMPEATCSLVICKE